MDLRADSKREGAERPHVGSAAGQVGAGRTASEAESRRTENGEAAQERLRLVAFERYGPVDLAVFPAPPKRKWMDDSAGRFAYRCLPLVMANQAGWLIRNPLTFSAMWNGGPLGSDVQVIVAPGRHGFSKDLGPETVVESHFGEGILTFQLPYLFRTPEGINLWVKGPANTVKDGIQALEGLVETDWSHAPFTMNWKFTRPFQTVTFLEGEPLCQLVPYPRGLVERFDPEVRPLADDPETHAAYSNWHAGRGRFLDERFVPGTDASQGAWQKDYYRGVDARGERVADHQTALRTKAFRRPEGRADE